MIDPFRYGGHSKNTKRSAYDDFRRRCRIAEESLDKLWPFVEANPGVTNASYEPTYFISDYIDMACVCSKCSTQTFPTTELNLWRFAPR